MLHNNARYEVEAWSSHYVILLVTGLLQVYAGRRLCFRVIVVHHATMQGIAGKWVCFESMKVILNAKMAVHQSSPVIVDCLLLL